MGTENRGIMTRGRGSVVILNTQRLQAIINVSAKYNLDQKPLVLSRYSRNGTELTQARISMLKVIWDTAIRTSPRASSENGFIRVAFISLFLFTKK